MIGLPKVEMVAVIHCEPDGEYEGQSVQVSWLDWVFQVTVARKEKRDAR